MLIFGQDGEKISVSLSTTTGDRRGAGCSRRSAPDAASPIGAASTPAWSRSSPSERPAGRDDPSACRSPTVRRMAPGRCHGLSCRGGQPIRTARYPGSAHHHVGPHGIGLGALALSLSFAAAIAGWWPSTAIASGLAGSSADRVRGPSCVLGIGPLLRLRIGLNEPPDGPNSPMPSRRPRAHSCPLAPQGFRTGRHAPATGVLEPLRRSRGPAGCRPIGGRPPGP